MDGLNLRLRPASCQPNSSNSRPSVPRHSQILLPSEDAKPQQQHLPSQLQRHHLFLLHSCWLSDYLDLEPTTSNQSFHPSSNNNNSNSNNLSLETQGSGFLSSTQQPRIIAVASHPIQNTGNALSTLSKRNSAIKLTIDRYFTAFLEKYPNAFSKNYNSMQTTNSIIPTFSKQVSSLQTTRLKSASKESHRKVKYTKILRKDPSHFSETSSPQKGSSSSSTTTSSQLIIEPEQSIILGCSPGGQRKLKMRPATFIDQTHNFEKTHSNLIGSTTNSFNCLKMILAKKASSSSSSSSSTPFAFTELNNQQIDTASSTITTAATLVSATPSKQQQSNEIFMPRAKYREQMMCNSKRKSVSDPHTPKLKSIESMQFAWQKQQSQSQQTDTFSIALAATCSPLTPTTTSIDSFRNSSLKLHSDVHPFTNYNYSVAIRSCETKQTPKKYSIDPFKASATTSSSIASNEVKPSKIQQIRQSFCQRTSSDQIILDLNCLKQPSRQSKSIQSARYHPENSSIISAKIITPSPSRIIRSTSISSKNTNQKQNVQDPLFIVTTPSQIATNPEPSYQKPKVINRNFGDTRRNTDGNLEFKNIRNTSKLQLFSKNINEKTSIFNNYVVSDC